MKIEENVSLSRHSTFRTGGNARFLIIASSLEDVEVGLAFARSKNLPWYVLGGGSNVLPSERGYEGVVIMPAIMELQVHEAEITSGAGVKWDDLVNTAAAQHLWGLENLAGIPGTVGASPIQNIGAYGTEVREVIKKVEALQVREGRVVTFSNKECAFSYRDSIFKREGGYIILRVTFLLKTQPSPNLSYADVASLVAQGRSLATPHDIGSAIRDIRAEKFPDLSIYGTAGSFFKNPIVPAKIYEALRSTYPALPGFPLGSEVKIPLAYVLDNILLLKGYRRGRAWLYDKQPLVLVLDRGGSSHEVDVLANDVAEKVFLATGIQIEREVQTLT